MSASPVAAVELIAGELERARHLLALAVDRAEALASLQEIAEQLEDRANEGLPPRARQFLSFDALLNVRGDEETRARVEALTRRIAPPEEKP